MPDRRARGGWRRPLAAAVLAVAAALPLLPLSGAGAEGAPTAVVVRGDGAGCGDTVARAVTRLGGTMTARIGILDGGAATVPARAVAYLRQVSCVASVTPDAPLQLDSIGGYDPTSDAGSLYSTTQMIGAQQLWKHGITGQGVGVALIDTGVAPVQGLDGNGQVINGPDLSFDSQTPALMYNDEYGHGTHMAGIIAGNDEYGSGARTYAGDTTHFLGVAPDAHILNMKVGDENGVVDVSQVIAAIDWVIQHRNDSGLNIRVLNLSFGTNSTQSYVLDPLAFAAEMAWHEGIVVVVAAGNEGNASAGLNDPAYDPYVLAVGAADTQGTVSTSDDTVAAFSNSGDGTRNPDLVAPGVHIASLRDPGSVIDLDYGSTATVATRFFRGSGTSQATAVTSGAAALLLQEFPNATPDQVKYALDAMATPLANQPSSLQGHGELNVAAAAKAKPGTSVTAALSVAGVSAALSLSSSVASPWTQTYVPATGTGSLEGARGDLHVVANGVELTGEQDIMGNAWNSSAMAQAEQCLSAWSGGTFNGAAWSGTGWSGTGWSGTAWSGTGWSGTAWSGTGWSGSTWDGTGWSGTGWSGTGWSGTGWSGAGWSGTGWSGTGWSGTGWSGTGWSGAGWSDAGWS